MAPLAIDMYLPAFPDMAVEFDVGASAVQFTLTAFLLGLAAGQLVIGPLSDRFGRRPLLLAGTALTAVFSVWCALAGSIELLPAGRFFQGFAGAAGIVLGRAVISDRASGPAAARLFGLLIVVNAIAPIIAPLVGGVIVMSFGGWRGVYWALTGLSVLMFVTVLLLVAETHPQQARRSGGARALLADARTLVVNRRYVGYTLAYACAFGVMFAYISGSSFVLQNVHGLSTGWYTVAFTANAVGLVIVSGLNDRVAARIGQRSTLRFGLSALALFAAAMVANALLGPVLWLTMVLMFCTMASLGLVIANATVLALGQAQRLAGTGSALLGALQFVLAAAITPLVGIAGEEAAVPMAIAMFTSAVLALGSLLVAGPQRRR